MKEYRTYTEMKKAHQDYMSNFPIIFAFSNKQLDEGMAKLGLQAEEYDKLLSVGAGGYIRKADRQAFHDLLDTIHQEEKLFKSQEDKLAEAIYYELGNREYAYTMDLEDTLNALDLTDLYGTDKRITSLVNRTAKKYLKENPYD